MSPLYFYMWLGSFFTSTHFCRISSSRTQQLLQLYLFTHLCFNAHSQCTRVLNLRSAVYCLTHFRWLCTITLSPIYPIIYYGNTTFICALLIYAQFFWNPIRAQNRGVIYRLMRKLARRLITVNLRGLFPSTDLAPYQKTIFKVNSIYTVVGSDFRP